MKNLLHIALSPNASHHRMFVLRDRTTGRDITEPKPLGLNALVEIDFDLHPQMDNVELVIFRGEEATDAERSDAQELGGSPVGLKLSAAVVNDGKGEDEPVVLAPPAPEGEAAIAPGAAADSEAGAQGDNSGGEAGDKDEDEAEDGEALSDEAKALLERVKSAEGQTLQIEDGDEDEAQELILAGAVEKLEGDDFKIKLTEKTDA